MFPTNNQFRGDLLKTIDDLFAHPSEIDKYHSKVKLLKQRLSKHAIFSLDSIVFSPIISMLDDEVFTDDIEALHLIHKQLSGNALYWNTYALKYDFLSLLNGDNTGTYNKLKELIHMYPKRNNDKIIPYRLNEYASLRNDIYRECQNLIKIDSLPEFLLSLICNTLLKLPKPDVKSFDIVDRKMSNFSLIHPISSIELVSDQIGYLEQMLDNMEGNHVIYVDVTLTSEGYLLNLR